MATRTGIYCRISKDTDGTHLGVMRQERDCRQYCARRGWDVARVYVDNDISAYKGKIRPAYKQMLADMKAGAITSIVCYDLDRLHRHPRELESFLDACDAAGIKDLGTVSGDVDLATNDGRLLARLLGAVARKESDDKSRRLRRKHLELAEAGKDKGGARCFGYESDRITVNKAEAELVGEAAHRVLAGETLYSVVMDFNERGIKTALGGTWRTLSLKRTLTGPRLAGLRTHHGKVVAKAEWAAILDQSTHEALISQLSRTRPAPVRSYLLTGGTAVCSLCGKRMHARTRQGRNKKSYACLGAPNFDGCGRVSIVTPDTDRLVIEAVLEAISTPQVIDAYREALEGDDPSDGIYKDLAALDSRMEALKTARFVEGEISTADYKRLRAQIEKKVDALQSRLAKRVASRVMVDVPAGAEALREWWEAAGLDQRRALIQSVVERVVVAPAKRGRNWFDDGRVEIVWRT